MNSKSLAGENSYFAEHELCLQLVHDIVSMYTSGDAMKEEKTTTDCFDPTIVDDCAGVHISEATAFQRIREIVLLSICFHNVMKVIQNAYYVAGSIYGEASAP